MSPLPKIRGQQVAIDIVISDAYLYLDSAKRRMKLFQASHPRGLLIADFSYYRCFQA
jgi:hypothetical protein